MIKVLINIWCTVGIEWIKVTTNTYSVVFYKRYHISTKSMQVSIPISINHFHLPTYCVILSLVIFSTNTQWLHENCMGNGERHCSLDLAYVCKWVSNMIRCDRQSMEGQFTFHRWFLFVIACCHHVSYRVTEIFMVIWINIALFMTIIT